MPNKDEIVNVNAAPEVASIQITINLGKPLAQQTQNLPERESQAPQGTFLRQVIAEPAANPIKKIRTSFVPDDLTQDTSTQIADPDPGERSKWKELLGDKVSENDIDGGDILMRLTEEGGAVTWLPVDASRNPVINRFKQKTPEEPNGASVADFITCWLQKGKNAAAAANCWSKLKL
jgi:hypothetical protein